MRHRDKHLGEEWLGSYSDCLLAIYRLPLFLVEVHSAWENRILECGQSCGIDDRCFQLSKELVVGL